jgi:hypothetical protein
MTSSLPACAGLILSVLLPAPLAAVMPAAQSALIASRPIVTPATWTPTLGKQTNDRDIPAYYTIDETPLYMASAFAPRPYALGVVGAATRFEIHQGDRNFADERGHTDCDRDELMARDDRLVQVGQAFRISMDFTIEPGPNNTARWLLLEQFHQDINTSKLPGSPPIALEMAGERLQLRVRWGANGNDGRAGNFNKVIWTDTHDVVRGHPFRITLSGLFDPVAGRLIVTKDDDAPIEYKGPLGYATMAGAYLAHGIYRATSPETMAVQDHLVDWWLSPMVP